MYKSILFFAILLMQEMAISCDSTIPLNGVFDLQTCDRKIEQCVPANEALNNYLDKIEYDDIFTVALKSSPWRLYANDGHILSVQELANMIRPKLKTMHKKHSVKLIASWSDTNSSNKNFISLSKRLSKALDNFPVSGVDGFLWVDYKGKIHSTKQAITTWKNFIVYEVKKKGDILVPMIDGQFISKEKYFIDHKSGIGMLHVGIGYDTFLLCSKKALKAFELSAKFNNPIGAYNAAIMHIEKGKYSDIEIAKELLTKAYNLGYTKAKHKLESLNYINLEK